MPNINTGRLTVAVASLLMVTSTPSHARLADRLECVPYKSMVCSIDGCHDDHASNLTFKVDIPKKVYARCDATGCSKPFNVTIKQRDNHLMVSHDSGVFMSIQIVDIKLENFDYSEPAGRFADMASSDVATILNYGQCSPAK